MCQDQIKAEEYLQISQCNKFGKCTWYFPTQIVRANKATQRKHSLNTSKRPITVKKKKKKRGTVWEKLDKNSYSL